MGKEKFDSEKGGYEVEEPPIEPRPDETKDEFVKRCVIIEDWELLTMEERKNVCSNIYGSFKENEGRRT